MHHIIYSLHSLRSSEFSSLPSLSKHSPGCWADIRTRACVTSRPMNYHLSYAAEDMEKKQAKGEEAKKKKFTAVEHGEQVKRQNKQTTWEKRQ
jgi:hypothetical protein